MQQTTAAAPVEAHSHNNAYMHVKNLFPIIATSARRHTRSPFARFSPETEIKTKISYNSLPKMLTGRLARDPKRTVQQRKQEETSRGERSIDARVERRQANDPVPRHSCFVSHVT